MTTLFYLFVLITSTAAGQAKTNITDHKKIAAIKKYVAAADRDTTLIKFRFGTPVNSGSTIMPPITSDTVCYVKDTTLQKISLSQAGAVRMDWSQKDYYFKDNKLVYVYEQYSNSSRMGACGTIVFTNTFFFDNDELIGYKTVQTPDGGPYSGCYPVTISAPAILMQLNMLLQRVQQVRHLSSH